MFTLVQSHRDDLLARYSEPHRAYHSQRHINTMLAMLDEVAPMVYHRPSVEAAIWYHDAIYDPLSKDNETNSAALFCDHFEHHLRHSFLDRVVKMIEATKRHELPTELHGRAGLWSDCGLFLDIDLAILGAPKDAFDLYEQSIRLEYAAVPDDKFNAGRRAILTKFLERPRIYFSDHFAKKLEAQARDNLAASILALS